eukprot:SAG31_NODE_13583_length_859_cov_1.205263_1_plen_60_part_10
MQQAIHDEHISSGEVERAHTEKRRILCVFVSKKVKEQVTDRKIRKILGKMVDHFGRYWGD